MTDPNQPQRHGPAPWAGQAGAGEPRPGWPTAPAGVMPPAPANGNPAPTFGDPAPQAGYTRPPAKKRPVGLIVGIVAGALLLLVGGVVVAGAVFSHHARTVASKYSFTVPDHASGYTVLTTADAKNAGDQIVSAVRGAGNGVWNNPKVGVYGKDGSDQPSIIVIALNVRDSPRLTLEMATHSLDTEAKTVVTAAGIHDATAVPPGRYGGTLSCGTLNGSSICIWLDHSTVGMVVTPPGTTQESAAAALAIRDAGEH